MNLTDSIRLAIGIMASVLAVQGQEQKQQALNGRWEITTDAEAAGQFCDLSADIRETRNLRSEKPEPVAEFIATMERLVNDGRSPPERSSRTRCPYALTALPQGSPQG